MNYRILTIAIALATGISIGLAQEAADTVKVIENASSIIVVTKDGKTTLDAEFPDKHNKETLHYQYEVNITNEADSVMTEEFSDNWGMELPFVKDKPVSVRDHKMRRYVGLVRRANWGWTFNYGDKGHVKNGWEVSIPDFVSLIWRRRGAEFEIGFGITASYRFAQDHFCYRKEGDKIVLVPVPEGMKVKKSTLELASFNFPVLYNQHVCKNFSFSLGGIVNLNYLANAHTKLSDTNNQYHKTSYKGLQQNFLTVDAYASVSTFNGIGIYAKWSPMKMFKKQFGPELKSFTVGIELSLGEFSNF